jgi:hypothetical protein
MDPISLSLIVLTVFFAYALALMYFRKSQKREERKKEVDGLRYTGDYSMFVRNEKSTATLLVWQRQGSNNVLQSFQFSTGEEKEIIFGTWMFSNRETAWIRVRNTNAQSLTFRNGDRSAQLFDEQGRVVEFLNPFSVFSAPSSNFYLAVL